MRLPIIILLALACGSAAAGSPALFYTDLVSGPNSGGRNNHGAVVCASGRNFRATQETSTVTIGGGAAAGYILWTDTKVCFALGSAAATGSVVVTVRGLASNPLPFTVRPGSIYYAGSTTDIGGNPGNPSDGHDGTFARPLATIRGCKNKVRVSPGSICYVRGSTPAQVGNENYGASLLLNGSGTLSAPLALIAWPGERPVVGDFSSANTRGISNYPAYEHWVIAGFSIRAIHEAILSSGGYAHFRIIGNKLQCPGGNGGSGCLSVGWKGNSPPQSMSLKVFGNEFTDIGCGEGATSGPDDAASASGQASQLPCAESAQQAITASSSNGVTVTPFAGSFNTSAIMPGDHLLVDTDGDGVFEDSLIVSLTASSMTLQSNSFKTVPFVGRPWKYRGHISSKLYHVTYFGTDTVGVEFAWNWIHNNSAIHGFNVHSTQAAVADTRAIASISAGSPARVTLSTAFAANTPVDGQRIDIVGNAQIAGGRFFVRRVDDTRFDLFTDPGLTTPHTAVSAGSGGMASKSGFGQFGLDVHDNVIEFQNGACISIANADPDRGPVMVYNNILRNCGTGPRLSGDMPQNMGGFYMLNTPDSAVNNLYGSGTVEIYNNTGYLMGQVNNPAFTHGLIVMAGTNPSLTIRMTNNIWSQPLGIPFAAGLAAGINRITGDTNLWQGTNTASIPPNTQGRILADPLFLDAAAGDFRVGFDSPSRDAGIPIPGLGRSLDGMPRPQGPGYDLGAYELPVELVPPVTSLVAWSATGTSASLGWEESPDPDSGYRVQRQVNGGAFTTLSDLPPGASGYTDSGLSAGVSYCYRLLAMTGLVPTSNEACAVPGAGTPDARPLRVSGNGAILATRQSEPGGCRLKIDGQEIDVSGGRNGYAVVNGLVPESTYSYIFTCGKHSAAGTLATTAAGSGTRQIFLRIVPPALLRPEKLVVLYGTAAESLGNRAEGECSAAVCVTPFAIPANQAHWIRYEYWRGGERIAASRVEPLLVN